MTILCFEVYKWVSIWNPRPLCKFLTLSLICNISFRKEAKGSQSPLTKLLLSLSKYWASYISLEFHRQATRKARMVALSRTLGNRGLLKTRHLSSVICFLNDTTKPLSWACRSFIPVKSIPWWCPYLIFYSNWWDTSEYNIWILFFLAMELE